MNDTGRACEGIVASCDGTNEAEEDFSCSVGRDEEECNALVGDELLDDGEAFRFIWLPVLQSRRNMGREKSD